MTKDRLEQFKDLAVQCGTIDDSDDVNESSSLAHRNHISASKQESFIERRPSLARKKNNHVLVEVEPKEEYMGDFFEKLEEIRKQITKLEEKIKQVDTMHTAILSSTKPDDSMKEQLDQQMSDIKLLSSDIRQKLKALELTQAEEANLKKHGAEWRIRKTQILGLKELNNNNSNRFITISPRLWGFNGIMNTYHGYQVEYREKCKGRIMRQLIITGRHMSEKEVEDALESGNPSVFTQGIIIETIQARQSLKDIQDRHNDIIKLEKSIRELKDMFTDISLLVESQGELIDVIERNVQQAEDFTESARQQTGKALTYKTKARRKKICIIICVIVAIIIIAIIITLSIALR